MGVICFWSAPHLDTLHLAQLNGDVVQLILLWGGHAATEEKSQMEKACLTFQQLVGYLNIIITATYTHMQGEF